MPDKFDWNLDPGSSDIQQFLSLDLNIPSGLGMQKPFSSMDIDGSKISYPCNDIMDVDSDFYRSSDISGSSLPNDDVWKKFGIYDSDEIITLNEEVSVVGGSDDMFDDLSNLSWMNPMYSQNMTNDAREIRNHDCMWAGHCVSEKHEGNNPINNCVNILPVKKQAPVQKSEEAEPFPLTPESAATEGVTKTVPKRSNIVAPTHARSLLLPSRVVSPVATQTRPATQTRAAATRTHTVTTSMRTHRSRTLDSGGDSPRPETPQSLSDQDSVGLDMPEMKDIEDLVADTLGYDFMNGMVHDIDVGNHFGGGDDFSMSQLERNQQQSTSSRSSQSSQLAQSSTAATPSNNVANKSRKVIVRSEVPIARHYTNNSFFSDHCYHLSNNPPIENLGVQTPSDSGSVGETIIIIVCSEEPLGPGEGTRPRKEEIDVETVYGDTRKPNSRSSSSSSVLPTNPSYSDRQLLQLTVASAINKKEVKKQSARTSASVANNSEDDRTLNARVVATGARQRKTTARNEVRRTSGNKRGAQFEDIDELINASAKRRRCQTQNNTKTGRGRGRRCGGRNSGRSSGGGSSDSEVDSIERRTIHNSMERQRRIDLRNSFEELRKLIPATADNEKAAKVLILNSGAEFCRALAKQDEELTKKKEELLQQQEVLLAKVSQLRRALAAQR